MRIFHYFVAPMAPLWTVLNDRPSRSSPFLKQLSDSLHALLLIAFDHDLLVSPEFQISDDRGDRKLTR